MITRATELIGNIQNGAVDHYFTTLYTSDTIAHERQRYCRMLELLEDDVPGAEAMLVASPGRTELAGNHTDHNHGCVLAGAIDLDCVAAVTPIDRPEIILISEQYREPIRVDLENLAVHKGEKGRTEALLRGVAAAVSRITGTSGGFYGRVDSTCHPGKGISSSAAFSVMVGGVLNFLFYGGKLTPLQLARIAHEAENNYFGKPCGMMDQMASALGGTVFIDFQDPSEPQTTRIANRLVNSGYRLAIIDTGSSHAELTGEYTAIRQEMQAASEIFGQKFARGITMEMLLGSIGEIRDRAGDRAVLRLIHFIEENDRTQLMAKYLKDDNFSSYLELVEASGVSSCNLLQNCSVPTARRDQGILLALATTKRICPEAVCRVHGGGFGGTIQAYVPEEEFDGYRRTMEEIFGEDSVMAIQLGRPGICGLSGDGFISTPVS
ncbi:MAG: galactokinase [Desulforhopalus sp.]